LWLGFGLLSQLLSALDTPQSLPMLALTSATSALLRERL
jgi:hypothetical protein